MLGRFNRRVREIRVFARAMQSASHPILAQIVPIRRCNLDCAYCNEYDRTSKPVPPEEMLRRIDKLGELGTSIITLSGGEPTLHPDLDAMIARIRKRGAIATLITNGLLLTPERIRAAESRRSRLSANQHRQRPPDDVSKKSLRCWIKSCCGWREYAKFGVTINSVLGAGFAIRTMR